jgi:NAD(P)-dependent dehydrogenase (short-subunit alcohol dehydrogenase family)
MDKRLDGKVAIVTGAGQTPGQTIGNGRAIAILFARAGAKVCLVDRNLESARETEALIAKDNGESFAFAADVTSSEDCRKMSEACHQRWGRIDILVNNVGTGGEALGPINLKEEDWERIFSINAKSVFLTCKHVMPYMEQQGAGSIVNISSIASVAASNMLAYKSSKSALNSMTHSIAYNYAAKGIRANVVMPGFIDTPIAIEGNLKYRSISREDLYKEREARIPLKGGMGTAWDTAYAALFFASDESKFVTGATLTVDGGQSTRIG